MKEYSKRLKSMIDEETLKIIMAQILLTLHYLELFEIIHRDIKPENILVDNLLNEYPDVFLADFGFATQVSNSNPSNVCGTPGYVAPEMFNN